MVDTTTNSTIEQRIVAAVRVVALAIIVLFYLWRIGALDPIARFGDDFFYYTLSAKNWVDGAGSTYFPGEPTNGYHPLWFLCIALLYRVAGDGAVFFALTDVAMMALTIGFFFLFQRFLQRLTGDRLAAVVGAAVAAITLCPIVMVGVETALVVVAAALLLDYLTRKPLADQTVRDAAVIGLLGAFLLLARLDAAFLVPGLLIALLFRWDWRRLAALVVGATPVYLYFAFNLIVYGHLGTTSMAAKSLTTHHWPPNLWFVTHPRPVEGVVVLTGVFVVTVAVAVMLRRSEDADMRRITLALAFATVLQLIAQAVLSGWVLFPWYLYFFLMTLGVAVALFVVRLRRWNALRRAGIPLGVLALVILPAGLVGAATPDLAQQAAVGNAAQLQAFAATHPGVYAMGDAAGAPAWVMGQPIVHLEGLMMSHDFLDRIRTQQPLEKVFRDYQVNYYVTMRPVAEENDCRQFAEPNPAQASPRAPVMTTTICIPPVEVVRTGDYRLDIYRIDPTTGMAF